MFKLERKKLVNVFKTNTVLCAHFLGMRKDQGSVFTEVRGLKLHLSTKLE